MAHCSIKRQAFANHAQPAADDLIIYPQASPKSRLARIFSCRNFTLLILFISLSLILLFAGTPLLTLSSYLPSLKSHNNLTQFQTNLIAECLSLGVTCMFTASIIIDCCSFWWEFSGALMAFVYGLTLICLSYVLTYFVWELKLSWVLYAVANWILGNGCVAIYMGSLSVASRVFALQSHGFVIGFLLAMYGGVGAAIYSQVVAHFVRNNIDLSYFFLLSAVLIGSAVACGVVLTFISLLIWSSVAMEDCKDEARLTWRQVLSRRFEYLRKKLFHKKKMAASLNTVVAGLISPRNEDDEDDITDDDNVSSMDNSLMASPAVNMTPYTDKHATTLLLDGMETPTAGIFLHDAETPVQEEIVLFTPSQEEAPSSPTPLLAPPIIAASPQNFTLLQALRQFDFWLIAACYCLTAATALFIIWNIGAMVISLGGRNGDQSNHVTVIALCSCVARLVFGFVSDRLAVRFSRAFFVLVAVTMSGLAQFYLLFANSSAMLFPGVILGSLAYGGINCSMPVIVRQAFGQKRFATIMSIIMILYQLLGGVAIASVVPALFYQHEIEDETSKYCRGKHCYRNVYILNLFLCILGGVMAFVLCMRRKVLRQWL